jgi:hypothetical protein
VTTAHDTQYDCLARSRFTQPDTIIPNPTNSQDLNRYTYVRNNPIRYTDPSGHDCNDTAALGVMTLCSEIDTSAWGEIDSEIIKVEAREGMTGALGVATSRMVNTNGTGGIELEDLADFAAGVADRASQLQVVATGCAAVFTPCALPAAPVIAISGGVSATASLVEALAGLGTEDQDHVVSGVFGVLTYGLGRGADSALQANTFDAVESSLHALFVQLPLGIWNQIGAWTVDRL